MIFFNFGELFVYKMDCGQEYIIEIYNDYECI